jgi:hypothetical protein
MGYKDGRGMEIYRPGEPVPAVPDRGPIGYHAEQGEFASVRSGPLVRFKGRGVLKTIHQHTKGLEIAAQYHTQAAAVERAQHARILAHHEAALLPQKLELQRLQLDEQLLQERMHMDAMLRDHQREAELAEIQHKTARQHAKGDRLEAEIRIKELKRALKDAGKKKKEAPATPIDDIPPEYKRASAVEKQVQRNRDAAEAEIDAIYAQARRERRHQLTAEEIEKVDAAQNSADAAESEVRRRAAGPL